eukprot:CCRYP_004567-RA/>CCRYP_004567-RA protein AED:0.10 eAED:0.10 QI:241/1/1/1/1/1/3/2557/1305
MPQRHQPTAPETRLSSILPPHAAVEILGDDARSVLRAFLRGCTPLHSQQQQQQQQQPHSQSQSGRRPLKHKRAVRYRHLLEPKESHDEKREIDLLLRGLSHDFSNAENCTPQTRREVAKAWSKLGFQQLEGYEYAVSDEWSELSLGSVHDASSTALVGGGISTHSLTTTKHETKKPTLRDNPATSATSTTTPSAMPTLETIFAHLVQRTSTVLGIDKLSFVQRGVLFPPTTLPDRGPNGHMALMDCIFTALGSGVIEAEALFERAEVELERMHHTNNSNNSSNNNNNNSSSGMGGGKRSSHDERMAQVLSAGRGKTRILLPDLLIAFAICRLAEWDLEYRGYLEERRRGREKKHEDVQRKLMELEKRIGEEEKEIAVVEEEEEEEDEEEEMIPPPRGDGLRLLSLLAFRIYDGYQRQNTLTRDTLQRFLSDIHGEDSYKTAPVRACLDRLFEEDGGASDPHSKRALGVNRHSNSHSGPRILNCVDPNQFQKGIHATISFTTSSTSNVSAGRIASKSQQPLVATHVLLDWILLLFNCMLPRTIPPPPTVAEYYLRIVNADPVKMIDSLSTKYGLYDCDADGGDNVLYEIRRRFHSLQKKSGTAEKERDVPGNGASDEGDGRRVLEGKSSSVGAANVCPETGELIVREEEEDSSVAARPKNVVEEQSFVNEVSRPNAELGHGGYLPAELARLTFRACADRGAEMNYTTSELWGGSKKENSSESKQPRQGNTESFWTLYDALSFGCDAVRWEALRNSSNGDADVDIIAADAVDKYECEMPLLRLAFKTFQQLPRQESSPEKENVLTRSQIGKMLLLLLEHESFRLEADSPPTTEEDADSDASSVPWLRPPDNGEVERSNSSMSKSLDETNDVLSSVVDASYASLLGLVPPKLDLSQYTTPAASVAEEKVSSKANVPLGVLVDYVISESKSSTNVGQEDILDFEGFVQWHLRLSSDSAMSLSETRLGPYLLDLRLIAAVLLGVRPATPSMEKYLIDEIRRRHKYRYPRTKSGASQPRGPKGTVWYVINADWWRTWVHFTEGKMKDDDVSGYVLGKIDNNMLLSEEGILSLKQGLHWQRDFQLVEPLVWSALQAWHDGGPPIPRSVVPFNPQKTDKQNSMSYSPAKSSIQPKEEYEIELYPLYATVFLCDATTQGEPRPFQQFVPLSRYLPLSELVNTLREGLGRDATKQTKMSKGVLYRPTVRLWMMDASSASMLLAASSPSKVDDSVGWILDTDLPIVDERNMRSAQLGKDENVCLMLELRNDEDGSWPRSKSSLNSSKLEQIEEERMDEEKDAVKLGDGIIGLYNMG